MHRSEVEVSVLQVPAKFVIGEDDRAPEFLQISPMGKLPALETPEGCIFGSDAVFRFVVWANPSTTLLGSTSLQQAECDQWIEFAASEIEPPLCALCAPVLGVETTANVQADAIGDMKVALMVLDSHLRNREFLVGECVTAADICVCMAMFNAMKLGVLKTVAAQYQHVFRWFKACVSQPQFSAVIS